MGPRPSQSPDTPPRSRARGRVSTTRGSRLAGFVSSLCVLAGVFFFINSACSRSTGDGGDPPECLVSTAAPTGASIAIIAPEQGAIFSRAEGDYFVEVPIELAAHGVEVNPFVCRDGAGYFEVSITRPDAEDCGAESAPLVFTLRDGSSELKAQLKAGNYAIRARFLNRDGNAFEPELVADTQITVVSAHLLEAGVPSCP